MKLDVSDRICRTKTGSSHVDFAIRVMPFDQVIGVESHRRMLNFPFDLVHDCRVPDRALNVLPETADVESDWLVHRRLRDLDHRRHGYRSVNVNPTRIAFPVPSALSYGNGEHDVRRVFESAERFLLFRDAEDVPANFEQSAWDTTLTQCRITHFVCIRPETFSHPPPGAHNDDDPTAPAPLPYSTWGRSRNRVS